MDAWGMSHETLQTDPEHSTGSVRVLIHGGEPHYEIVTDCVYDFIARELLEEKTPRAFCITVRWRSETRLRVRRCKPPKPDIKAKFLSMSICGHLGGSGKPWKISRFGNAN
jgi:hypothetical protein